MVSLAQDKFYSTPSRLAQEVKSAREKCRRYLGVFEKQLQRYHSRHYMGKQDSQGEEVLENHYHDWLSYIVPRIIFQNPKVELGTTKPAAQGQATAALEAALNRWIKDNRLRDLLAEGPAVDMQFNMGVTITSQSPIPGARPVEGLDPDMPELSGVPHSPKCYRIPQDLYFDDGLARQKAEVRFQGHVVFRDKADILAEAEKHPERGWNTGLVQNLATEDTNDRLGRDPYVASERGEVSYLEVYIPELELDRYPDGRSAPAGGWRKHGFNGTILTITDEDPTDQTGYEWLRPPRPFYGPPEGPYTTWGVYTVPGQTKPLAPLVAVEEQVRDLNAHTKVQSSSAADYKRLVIINDTSPRIAQVIKSLEHHYVAPIPGFDGSNIKQVEVGGITDQMIAYIGIARDRLNRNAHMDDARRGEVTGQGTATEVSEAASAAEVRMSWVEECFVNGVVSLLRKVLWYLYYDNRVAFPLGAEAAEALQMAETVYPPADQEGLTPEEVDALPPQAAEHLVSTPEGVRLIIPPEPWFHGGTDHEEASFESLQLEIKPYSMQREDQATMREGFMTSISMIFNLLPMVALYGDGVDWKRVFNEIGEHNGIPDIGERFDVDELLKRAETMDPRLLEPVLVNQATGVSWPTAQRAPGQTQPGRGGGGRGAMQSPLLGEGAGLGLNSSSRPGSQGSARSGGFGPVLSGAQAGQAALRTAGRR